VSEWQPLSIREGRCEPDGPFEGVPPHLVRALSTWLDDVLTWPDGSWNEPMAEAISIRLRVPTTPNASYLSSLRAGVAAKEQFLLDAVDYALTLVSDERKARYLDLRLSLGGSVYAVSKRSSGLQRRVSSTAQDTYERASTPEDSASEQLTIAWKHAFGRNPEASDAWDHSIKAVETVLIPIVETNNAKATLGGVIGSLCASPEQFRLGLPGHDASNSVVPLVTVLRLIWPNPDRAMMTDKRTLEQHDDRLTDVRRVMMGILGFELQTVGGSG
jgi:hypothetical protein